jgi:hypothetical protein
MASTVQLAQATFPQLEGWIRVIGAPSLDALKSKAQRAQDIGLRAKEALRRLEFLERILSVHGHYAIANRIGRPVQ